MFRYTLLFVLFGSVSLPAMPHTYTIIFAGHSTLSEVTIGNVTNDSVFLSASLSNGTVRYYSVLVDSIINISPDVTITGVFSRIGATIGGIYALVFRTGSGYFLDGVTNDPILRYFGYVLIYSAIGGICGYVVGWLLPSDEYHIYKLSHSEKVRVLFLLCPQQNVPPNQRLKLTG